MKLNEIAEKTNEEKYIEVLEKFYSSNATFKKLDNGKWQCTGNITLPDFSDMAGHEFAGPKLPVKFEKITGGLSSMSSTLESFDGFPNEITKHCHLFEGEFESLEGLTPKIGETLRLEHLSKLKSLKGCPKTILGIFRIANVPQLKSLKHGPEVVNGDFIISDKSALENLEHLPHTINGSFSITTDFFSELLPAKDFLQLYNVRGLKRIIINKLPEVADILNKWLPTRDIIQAGKELDSAGFNKYSEY